MNAFSTEIRRRLGPPPRRAVWPSVSIVVLNRDGAPQLRRLLDGLVERTDYPSLELILVDNASSDDSLELARPFPAPFPISILSNHFNESFSDGCNQGAELATGELLLFLNNDTEPIEPGWLWELVACLELSGAGAAGPTLLEPVEEGEMVEDYVVQQRGLAVREVAEGVLGTALRERGSDPLCRLGEDATPLAVAGACLLIERRLFESVGGFSHGYVYGPEDLDLALKLREAGHAVVCSGRSLLAHPMGTTLRRTEQRGDWVRANRRLFFERWGPRVRREFELDRLTGGGLWADPGDPPPPGGPNRESIEALGYCLEGPSKSSLWLADLKAELRRRGVRCGAVTEPAPDDLHPLEYDVAVHLGGARRLLPRSAQMSVLLCDEAIAEAIDPIERSRFDLVLGEPPAPAPAAVAKMLLAVEHHAEEIAFETRIGRRIIFSQ